MSILNAGRAPSTSNIRFKPLDPTIAAVTRQRPLALDILSDYGNPVDPAERVSAIVDWVARTAVHGHSDLRLPTPYLSGTGTLPPGETWETVQAWLTGTKQIEDNVYWERFKHDAGAMLDVLLGTLAGDGTRTDDGAMVRVNDGGARAHYRYKTLSSIRSMWCTWQHDICTLLLASLGYPSMLCHITGHDPLRVQYGASGEWGYWCATYNEHYALPGLQLPLDILELRDLTQNGLVPLVERQIHAGPFWDATQYVSASYFADHPDGIAEVGMSLDSRIVPGGIVDRLDRTVAASGLPSFGTDQASNSLVSERVAEAYLGAYVSGLPWRRLVDTAYQVASAWPGTVGYVIRSQGQSWSAFSSAATTVSVSVADNSGQVDLAPVDVWGQVGPMVSFTSTPGATVGTVRSSALVAMLIDHLAVTADAGKRSEIAVIADRLLSGAIPD